MRRLVITEEYGLWTVETSAGVRAQGMSLPTALEKLLPLGDRHLYGWGGMEAVFDGIRPSDTGQIREGVQS